VLNEKIDLLLTSAIGGLDEKLNFIETKLGFFA